MRVLIFGDSIVQGFWDSQGGWADRLKKHYMAKGLEDIHQRGFVEVFNLGVSGDTSKNLLARIENEVQARKWPGEAQTVLLAIGTNDDVLEQSESGAGRQSFQDNLELIISRLKGNVEQILLIGNNACDEKLTTPVFWADISYTNKQLKSTEEIIIKTAVKLGIPVVPIFEEYKMRLERNENLLEDGLHPNDAGHELIFKLVQPVLDKLLN